MAHAVASLVGGLAAAVLLFPAYVSVLARLRAGQRVQSYSPASHVAKAGTPTMGGLLFVAVAVAAYLLLDRSRSGFVLCFAVLAGGLVGLFDDLVNIRGRGDLGLVPLQKIALQAVVGVLVGWGLYVTGATAQLLPWGGTTHLGALVIPLGALAVIAASNAVNLTDGVDGLAASCSVMAFVALLVVALRLHAVPSVVLCAVMLGLLLGFLVYNWSPARVFMGDTGSLAIGCALAAVSAELGLLWFLPILGLVFVVETLSVIVNVTAIKRFHHRLLRASPLHHHYEAQGVGEDRLVSGFAVVAAAAALLTLALSALSLPRV